MAFLYLPTTERTYVIVGGGSGNSNGKGIKSFRTNDQDMFDDSESDETTTTTTTTTRPFTTSTTPTTATTSILTSEPSTFAPSTKRVATTEKSYPICVPMEVDFCRNVSSMTTGGKMMQSIMDDKTIEQLRGVVASQCYPFAAHFLCSWGVACSKGGGDSSSSEDTKEITMPCRDYCDEFMANCGQRLPKSIKEKIRCGGDWNGSDSCVPKPGCVKNLYALGQGHRICDGVMDCIDFSDECKHLFYNYYGHCEHGIVISYAFLGNVMTYFALNLF